MDKPIGPINRKVKDNPPFAILALFSLLLFLFIIGASTCNIGWNTYKSKADCTFKILLAMEKRNQIVDPEMVTKVEDYCKRYDR